MADSNPKFDRKAFKEALAMVESSGGKFLENPTSSAVGRYQFLWNNIKSDPQLKGVTKRQFINSRDLQEQVMDMALDGKLKSYPNYIANAQKLQKEFDSDLRVDEIALLTHFLGAGGVRAQLKTGDYKVPGVNSSVKDYTGKYNRYLNEIKGDASNDTPQPTQEIAPVQQEVIDNQNVPNIDEVKEVESTAYAGGYNPVDNRVEGMSETIDIQQDNQRPLNASESAEYDESKVGRIRSLLSMDDSGYNSKFKNIEDPADNIVGQNQMNEGGLLDNTDPVKGKTTTTTTTGDPVRTTSITPILGEDGQSIGSRREVNTTTSSNERMETPFTQEGDDAYAALDQAGKNAQDAKWNEIRNRPSSNTVTDVDETYSMNFEPQGIKLNSNNNSGLNIDSPQIQQVASAPERAPMFHVGGTNKHNKKFGWTETSMITSDPNVQPSISYRTSPGDISTDSPMSGRRNTAIKRQLTDAEQDAAETVYGQNWHRPIPEDIGAEMLRRESENTDEIQRRALTSHERQLAIREKTLANRQANADRRSQNSMAKGGMIKRADGSYSKRGLWDNIRANKGSGKKPTKSMLEQERKINAKAYGGSVESEDSENFVAFKGGGTHEQNPLGGIPQGMGSNGKLNTVEEGETKVSIDGEEYIFSERGRLDGSGFDTPKQTNKYAMGGPAGMGLDPMTGMPLEGAGAAAGGEAAGAAAGGGMSGMGAAGMGLDVAKMGLELIPDKGDEKNQTGIEGIQQQGDSGLAAAKGAASGASMGAVAGPWGMAAGAVIGGAVALIGSNAANKKIQEENKITYAQANPALQNQNYGGGYMKKKKSTKKTRVKAFLRK